MTLAADRHAWAAASMVAAATIIVAAGCSGPPAGSPDPTLRFGGPTMGTTWALTVVPGSRTIDAAERGSLDREVRDLLARIEILLSTWNPESELSRFNRSQSTEPFAVAPETFDVFRWALALGTETDGAFDMTVLPIVEAWGFGAGGNLNGSAPDAATLGRLKAATGPGSVELDPGGRWVRKRVPGVACDVSGLAPGYAADLIAAALEQRGLTDFLLDVGGELVGRGQNADGLPWQVAVERPDELVRSVERVVPLTGMAIATSGDYRNYRELDGRRIVHIIDPRTAEPVSHRLASVSVIDTRAVRADGLATALMALGPDDGLALATRLGVAALFIVRSPAGDGFEERMTPQFETLTRTK